MASNGSKIKKLRDTTGISLQEIKKALEKAEGDEGKALELLKSLGVSMAAKKSSREVKEGVISSYIHTNKKKGAMIELWCETDFVARNSEFQDLAFQLALHITALKPANIEELLKQEFVKDPTVLIEDLINQNISKLGENIKIGRFEAFEI